MEKTDRLFETEASQTLQRLKESVSLKELNWFWELLDNHFQEEYLADLKPDMILIGTEIPMELAYAFSNHPFYILGGSLQTTHWADAITPRDTDPVNKSALGWLMNPSFHLSQNAVIITTAASDSRRKMASILRNAGKTVIVLDVMPDNGAKDSGIEYQKQLERLIVQLEKRLKTELSEKKLIQTNRMVRQARLLWQQFEVLNVKKGSMIPKEVQIALMQSMYFTSDLKEWSKHLGMLIEEMEKTSSYFTNRFLNKKPQILLAGSPVIYPNLKIPQLIEAAGMEIASVADSIAIQTEDIPRRSWKTEKCKAMLNRIAKKCILTDASGSRIKNTALLNKIKETLNNYEIEGIVYHVLKGQIEYDFELAVVEKIAEERDIPIFRLETDYQYQDVEQLRIRMEAFGEMLCHRHNTERKLAI